MHSKTNDTRMMMALRVVLDWLSVQTPTIMSVSASEEIVMAAMDARIREQQEKNQQKFTFYFDSEELLLHWNCSDKVLIFQLMDYTGVHLRYKCYLIGLVAPLEIHVTGLTFPWTVLQNLQVVTK
jgi:hypothetical protein